MQLTGIHHCSLAVTDMKRALAFYIHVLGLQEIAIPVTFPAAGLHVRWLQIGSQHIHLIPVDACEAPSPRHVALHVADVEAARRELAQHGIPIWEAPPIPGAERVFVADPDGNAIELIAWHSN